MRRDFWTWFFNGNCPPAVAATAEYISSTVNQMCVFRRHVVDRHKQSLICEGVLPSDDRERLTHELAVRRPNLGPHAYIKGWHFDFTVAYVGAGFITPLSVRCTVTSVCQFGIEQRRHTHLLRADAPAGLQSEGHVVLMPSVKLAEHPAVSLCR